MNATIAEIDTSGFTSMCEALARISGKDYKDILVNQAGALLKVCISKTPARSAAAIIKKVSRANNYIQFASGHVISFWKKANVTMFLDDSNFEPRKGQKSPNVNRAGKAGGKTWHLVDGDRRWSNERWARYQTFEAIAKTMRRNPKDAVKGRGLAKQTWLQIADAAGANVPAPGYVRNAVGPGGRTFREGTASTFLEAAAFYLELRNANPIMGKLRGREILQRAVNARLKAFSIEMEKGVFDDVVTRAKRYPGIFTA